VGSTPALDGHRDVAAQIHLALSYREMLASGRDLPSFRDVGFRVHSQTDEDGILLFLFSVLGATTRTSVEICAGDGIECNTANLLLHHGWYGLLVDGDERNVARGRQFYASSPDTYVFPPSFVQSWVTRGGVNDLIAQNGFSGEIDLLSIDLDGVDYWIWDAIEVVTPRVVVVEYLNVLGPERSWTVPYSDDFRADRYLVVDGTPTFFGASLSAFVKLGQRKGYRLVGVNRYGYNAFFVRDDLLPDRLPPVQPAECFSHPQAVTQMRERFSLVQGMPWVSV
jgi:hypothetical protein